MMSNFKMGRNIALTVLLALGGINLAQAGAIALMQQFLQNTKTLKAEFSQTVLSNSGRKPQLSSGNVLIARPGKLRWDIQQHIPRPDLGEPV